MKEEIKNLPGQGAKINQPSELFKIMHTLFAFCFYMGSSIFGPYYVAVLLKHLTNSRIFQGAENPVMMWIYGFFSVFVVAVIILLAVSAFISLYEHLYGEKNEDE